MSDSRLSLRVALDPRAAQAVLDRALSVVQTARSLVASAGSGHATLPQQRLCRDLGILLDPLLADLERVCPPVAARARADAR